MCLGARLIWGLGEVDGGGKCASGQAISLSAPPVSALPFGGVALANHKTCESPSGESPNARGVDMLDSFRVLGTFIIVERDRLTCAKRAHDLWTTPDLDIDHGLSRGFDPAMTRFRFGRVDLPSPIVTWSSVAICTALLSLLLIDANLVAQYLATMFVSSVSAGIAIFGLGRLRAAAIAKEKIKD